MWREKFENRGNEVGQGKYLMWRCEQRISIAIEFFKRALRQKELSSFYLIFD